MDTKEKLEKKTADKMLESDIYLDHFSRKTKTGTLKCLPLCVISKNSTEYYAFP